MVFRNNRLLALLSKEESWCYLIILSNLQAANLIYFLPMSLPLEYEGLHYGRFFLFGFFFVCFFFLRLQSVGPSLLQE